MQAVFAVVLRQAVFFTVYRELAVGDSVAVSADYRAKVVALFVVFKFVESKRYVGELPVAVGRFYRRDYRAVIADFYGYAAFVFQGKKLYVLPVVGFSPVD